MRPVTLSALLLSLIPGPASAAQGAASGTLPAWDYRGGANDDEGWATLSPAYAACAAGTQQSPVAINAPQRSSMLPLRFAYVSSPVIVQRRDKALLLQFGGGSTVRSEGVDYTLRQIRFHTPAEHSIASRDLPLEMHFIHQAEDRRILIIAVQGQEGAGPEEGSEALARIAAHLPERGAPEKHMRLDPGALLPDAQGYYAYTGSLSWPPCIEGVAWRVMKKPITVSRAQLQAISRLTGRNARLLQPLYLRIIQETID